MAEYIKRAAVEEMLGNAQIIFDGEYCGYCMEDVNLNSIPAAGVAPVVRCQECIHWMAEGGAGYKSLGTYRCPCARWSNDDGYTAYTDPDDFCVYGEEKEEEQNDE